ncbi:ClpXP adapter SpxH family protein [Bacillus gobiensis]|uniref:ClpXP adapter SpxH family protein n=1 Tax=Bacillus gobiensis TaxID=1441095 RepID=UPI003D1F120E
MRGNGSRCDQYFSHCHGHPQKPIEIFMFIDPTNPECWDLEPAIKKLKILYGRFFSLRPIVIVSIATLNNKTKKKNLSRDNMEAVSAMPCDAGLQNDSPSASYNISLALKAAELQGRKAGLQFLRNLQEVLFVKKQDITKEKTLLQIAEMARLDVKEFKKDLHSANAITALQCDIKIAAEMDVKELPTLAFFNTRYKDEGLKVSGNYPYSIYEEVLFEMLDERPKPSETPPLELFLEYFQFVAAQEIAIVYDLSLEEVERQMKRLAFANKVKRVQAKQGVFWRYVNSGISCFLPL